MWSLDKNENWRCQNEMKLDIYVYFLYVRINYGKVTKKMYDSIQKELWWMIILYCFLYIFFIIKDLL